MLPADMADVAFAIVVAFGLHYNRINKFWQGLILCVAIAIILVDLSITVWGLFK